MPGSIRCRYMRCRHVGQEGRSVGNSCGNPLARMDALRQCQNVNQKRCRRLYGCRQELQFLRANSEPVRQLISGLQRELGSLRGGHQRQRAAISKAASVVVASLLLPTIASLIETPTVHGIYSNPCLTHTPPNLFTPCPM